MRTNGSLQRNQRYRFSLGLAVSLLLVAPIAFAQTTGNIEGRVFDQNSGPLPGVTVEVTSPNLQGTGTAATFAPSKSRMTFFG